MSCGVEAFLSFLVDVFAALGYPELGNVPTMRCKLNSSVMNSEV